MNKNLFKGFYEIKADDYLLARTKKKMSESAQKRKLPFSVRKLAFASIPVIAAVVALTIIFSNVFSNQFVITAKAQDLMQGIKSQNLDVSNAVTDNFINSTQNFSVNLFKQSYKSGENTLVSPVSACLALGMTSNGASGKTLAAFQNVLGKYGMTIGDLNKAYKAYANELTEKRGSTTTAISNSIWFRTGFAASKAFLQNNADYFGAGARTLNFNDANSINLMNNWVKNNTDNKIDKIIDKLNKDDVMYLINALYFEAKWQKPFDTVEKPSSGIFNLDNGSTTQSTFMKLSDNLDYMKGKNESAVLLPYDDGRFAMLCILPNEGVKLSDYIKTMTKKTITDLISQKTNNKISVILPQFKVTSDNKLNDTLKNMGLGVAFDESSADFSKMGKYKSGLYISYVRQKTFLQVDELGTQAGASTAVVMQKECAVQNCLNFNRPFVYAIIDTQTNLPLFLGAMEKPQSTLAASPQ